MADLPLMLYLNEAHSTRSLEKLGQESCVCAEFSEELGQESLSLCIGFLKARISCVWKEVLVGVKQYCQYFILLTIEC